MIFEKGVYNLHLISGEDVIGQISQIAGGNYTVSKPVTPTVSMDVTSQHFKVGLLPLRPYLGNVDEVEIARDHVLYKLPVTPQMEKLYQQFTSSITIASPSDVPNFDTPIGSFLNK